MSLREPLLATARLWSDALLPRPGVAAVFLYGSLAGDPDELTEFSDVDMALVLDDGAMPAHFAEHRILNGVKTDTTLLAASTLRGWASVAPKGLFAGHWTNSLFLKALTLGSDDIALHDPHGLVAAARAGLPDYRTLSVPDTRSWLDDFRCSCLEKAEAALAAGDPKAARAALPQGWLAGGARYLTGDKRLETAAARLGIPQLVSVLDALRAIGSPPPEVWEASCDAVEALGRHVETHFYAPVFDALRRQGDAAPGAREFVGDLAVFWPGNRIHSLERIAAEWGESRRGSRRHRERGEWRDARGMLWTSEPGSVEGKAAGLRDALAAQGFDIAAETDAFLQGTELARLNAVAAEAEDRRAGWPVSERDAREALALAWEAHALLAGAVDAQGFGGPVGNL